MLRLLSTSSVALIVAAAPVLAEVTPTQVWDSIIESYRSAGYAVTEGSRDEAGETLTVRDVTLSLTSTMPTVADDETGAPADAAAAPADGTDPAAEPTVTMTPITFDLHMPAVVLTRTGDGNVRTVHEGDWTGKMVSPEGQTAETPSFDLTLAMPGNEMISSGEPGNIRHELNYPETSAVMNMTDPSGTTIPLNLKLSLIHI